MSFTKDCGSVFKAKSSPEDPGSVQSLAELQALQNRELPEGRWMNSFRVRGEHKQQLQGPRGELQGAILAAGRQAPAR